MSARTGWRASRDAPGDNGSVQDDERAESDIRKRAAWLLAMLAVVAGLFVLLSVTLLKSSGGGNDTSQSTVLPTDVATSSVSPTAAASTTPTAGSSTSTPPTSSPSTSGSPATSASSGPVPTPSCPSKKTCAVTGDVNGAMTAINAYRSEHSKKAVPTSTTSAAEQCALTEGDTCPSSFVWVRVDDLSGSSVVTGVTGFNSSDDLLDDSAKSFEVGWAYDPGSKTVSCALIRRD